MELEDVLKRLVEHKVEFVLVGGLASVLHGAPIVTQDVDVCFHFSKENLERLRDALSDLNPKHRITPQRLPLEITENNWTMFKNLYLETDIGILDCLGEITGLGGFDAVMNLSEESDLGFGTFRILKIEALIQAKEAAGRPRDLTTVSYLKVIKATQQKPGLT